MKISMCSIQKTHVQLLLVIGFNALFLQNCFGESFQSAPDGVSKFVMLGVDHELYGETQTLSQSYQLWPRYIPSSSSDGYQAGGGWNVNNFSLDACDNNNLSMYAVTATKGTSYWNDPLGVVYQQSPTSDYHWIGNWSSQRFGGWWMLNTAVCSGNLFGVAGNYQIYRDMGPTAPNVPVGCGKQVRSISVTRDSVSNQLVLYAVAADSYPNKYGSIYRLTQSLDGNNASCDWTLVAPPTWKFYQAVPVAVRDGVVPSYSHIELFGLGSDHQLYSYNSPDWTSYTNRTNSYPATWAKLTYGPQMFQQLAAREYRESPQTVWSNDAPYVLLYALSYDGTNSFGQVYEFLDSPTFQFVTVGPIANGWQGYQVQTFPSTGCSLSATPPSVTLSNPGLFGMPPVTISLASDGTNSTNNKIGISYSGGAFYSATAGGYDNDWGNLGGMGCDSSGYSTNSLKVDPYCVASKYDAGVTGIVDQALCSVGVPVNNASFYIGNSWNFKTTYTYIKNGFTNTNQGTVYFGKTYANVNSNVSGTVFLLESDNNNLVFYGEPYSYSQQPYTYGPTINPWTGQSEYFLNANEFTLGQRTCGMFPGEPCSGTQDDFMMTGGAITNKYCDSSGQLHWTTTLPSGIASFLNVSITTDFVGGHCTAPSSGGN